MAGGGVQRLVLRTLLSLPPAVLRALSGGGVVWRGGRTLDPRLQFLAHASRGAPPLTGMTPEEARRASAEGIAPLTGRAEPGVRKEAVVLEGPGFLIPLRVYRPQDQDPTCPVIVWAHFGGGVIGDLETSDGFCQILARVTRAPVLSVEYRLAPENRFPAGLEDVMCAYRWAREHATRFGAPEDAVAIGGDSMGGGFAAVIPQELKRSGEPQPRLQLLIYPLVDVASESASMTTYADAFPLNRATLDWFRGHYMGPEDDPADPRLSPLKGEDLSGLAPAVVVTAGFDPLLDQGEAYALRLREAGVPTVYRCYDHLAHAFTAYTGAVPAADVACRAIAGLVREGLQGRIC